MGILANILSGIAVSVAGWSLLSLLRSKNIFIFISIGVAAGIIGTVIISMTGFGSIGVVSIYGIAVTLALAILPIVGMSIYGKVKLPKVPMLDEHELKLSGS